MIKTILFDFGGVLGPDADDWGNFHELVEISGLDVSEIKQLWERYWINIRVGKYDLDVLWKEVADKANNNVTAKELNRTYIENIRVFPELMNYVKVLKEQGCRLVILSNDSKTGMNVKIEKFHLFDIFKKIYCSAYLGLAKPDKAIFGYALNDLEISVNEVILVDNQESNIKTANKLGIKAILYKDLNQLKNDLGY